MSDENDADRRARLAAALAERFRADAPDGMAERDRAEITRETRRRRRVYSAGIQGTGKGER